MRYSLVSRVFPSNRALCGTEAIIEGVIISGPPSLTLTAVVLGAPNARDLGDFYQRLLGLGRRG